MTMKDLVRPLPGVRSLSILRQQLTFRDSASFWERSYVRGETSGPGSYGDLAVAKAAFLNTFVEENRVQSVVEFGCGDGHQLSLARYPYYIGLDVSPTAIQLCSDQFARDSTKSFFLYNGNCFADRLGLFRADVAISLDVIYHLIEDSVLETYMHHLFAAGRRFVVIYSTDNEVRGTAPHVRHRRFSGWVEERCPSWRLIQMMPGPDSGPGRADFFVYEQVSGSSS